MIDAQRSIIILFFLAFLIISCESEVKNTSKISKDIQALTEIIQKNPQDASKYIDRADYYRLHEGYDEAILDYRKAIEIDDTKPEYYFDLADTHMDYLDSHSARVVMDAVVKKFPNHVDARLKLARLLIILKEYNETKTHLQRAKIMDPFNAETEYLRGVFFLDQGKPEAASKAFQATVELDDQWTDAWTALGQIASDQRDPKALIYFDNAIDLAPEDISALHAKAYYLQNADQIDEALTIYQQINSIDSTYELAYLNRSLLLLERNDLDGAETLLKKCAAIKPKMASAYYYLGIIREKQKRYEEALSYYRDAQSADPNFSEATEAINDFIESEN